MRNYINNLKANSKKGFSLVELIIVIAIMAILVGVVASQVIPYMEKSRKGKDQQEISSLTTSIVTAVSDHSTAITTFDATAVSAWDTQANCPDTDDDMEFTTTLKSLLSSDGDGSKSGTSLAGYMEAMAGKFKSKLYKDEANGGANIKAVLPAGGSVTTYVGSGTLDNAKQKDVKLVAEAE